MNEEKTIWLQIPNRIIRNTELNIDEKSFAIYAFLLFKKFKVFNINEIEVLLSDIKAVTGIVDNRTLKKCFVTLHTQGLVRNKVVELPINKPIRFEMSDFSNENFTQIPLKLLKLIDSIGLIGFRLMYYYESYINRKNVTNQFCYPSYETIQDDLKISNFSITKYNKILVNEKLLTITKHKAEYDPFGDSGLERFNNHYTINLYKI